MFFGVWTKIKSDIYKDDIWNFMLHAFCVGRITWLCFEFYLWFICSHVMGTVMPQVGLWNVVDENMFEVRMWWLGD